MKLCYIDESGTGDEPYAVMVGIIIDSYRMRPTKTAWSNVLRTLSTDVGRTIEEIHTRDFYSGNGPWRGIDGRERARIIGAIFDWIEERKHEIVFCSIDKEKFNDEFPGTDRYNDIKTIWRMLGLHLVLCLQKHHQKCSKNKGNTVLIFDNEETERLHFTDLILNPPDWTDSYYSRGKKQEKLDQIIDVPHFADSKHVPLLQVADFVAYFLRRYAELENGAAERYAGERNTVASWAQKAKRQRIPIARIYPRRNRCECAELFFTYAPECLKT